MLFPFSSKRLPSPTKGEGAGRWMGGDKMTQTKTALITGASRRIGADMAKTLVHQGYQVLIHYAQSESAAIDLQAELNQQIPQSAYIFKANLNVLTDIQSLVNFIQQTFQRLDVLVNNASSFFPSILGEVTENIWDDLMGSNFKGPFFLTQALLPLLKSSKGSIVNILDIQAENPLQDYSVYCAAKAGLLCLTKAFAKELAPEIRVNGISPGCIIWPEGLAHYSDETKQQIIKKTPLHKIGKAENISETLLFLLNNDFVTGEIINVDGGRSLV